MTSQEASPEVGPPVPFLVESAPLAMTALDAGGKVTHWNPAAERLFGWRAEEVLGALLPILPEMEVTALLQRSLTGDSFSSAEARYRRKDGSFVEASVSTAPLKDHHGQVVGLVGIFQDITHRKQVEKTLRVSQAKFAGIIAIATDAIISVDEAQRITVFNRGAERIFGYTEEEVMGQPLGILLPERFRRMHQQHLQGFSRSSVNARLMGERQQIFGRRKNGEEFAAEASISSLEVEDQRVFTVILRDITERRQIEDALRFSEAKFAGIVSLATDAIIAVDETQRITSFNTGAEQIFGYLAEELIGKDLDLLLPERFRAMHREHIRTFSLSPVTARTMGQRREIFGRRKNGEEFPAEASILKLDVAGQQVFAVVLRDVSERKQTETMLRRQAALIDLAHSPVVVRDLDDRITLWNRAAEACYGWMAAEALGRVSHELLRTRFPMPLEEIRRTLLRTGSWEGELLHTRRSGEEIAVDSRWALQRDEAGAPLATLEINMDITARKRAEGAERLLAQVGLLLSSTLDSESRLENLARLLVPDLADCTVIQLLGERKGLEQIEVAAVDAEQEATLRALVAAYPRDADEAESLFARVVRTGEPLLIAEDPVAALGRAGRDEHLRAILDRLAPRSLLVLPLLARGRTLGAVALATCGPRRRFDDHDLALAEELCHRAALAIDNGHLYRTARQAVAARDDVLRIVYHDLGNPVQAIGMVAGALQRRLPEGETGEQLRESLQLIRATVDDMERLIQDLLDAARIEAGHLALRCEPLPPSQVVMRVLEALRPLADQKSIRLAVRMEEDLPTVSADRTRLRQVLQNLIGNAIKFTPTGGRITVEVRPSDEAVEFRVADSGPGIPPEHLPHLFDRFWQARQEHRAGAGLGLAIAKGIVEAHGGRIWVESTPGEGSLFCASIPAPAPEET